MCERRTNGGAVIFPERSTSRWRHCRKDLVSSTRPCRSSCTARAAAAHRSLPASSSREGSIPCRTSPVGTTAGLLRLWKSRNESPGFRARADGPPPSLRAGWVERKAGRATLRTVAVPIDLADAPRLRDGDDYAASSALVHPGRGVLGREADTRLGDRGTSRN